jgi:hypothetical protein
MIGTIDIEINAGHTNLPLSTVYAAVGSPLTIRVVGVPAAQGAAKVTAVTLAVTYPDNTAEEVKCVAQTDGSWIGTLAGSTVVGVVGGGLKVLADGTNEQGSAVVGWVLGFGDIKILSTTATPTPASTIQPLADQYNLKQVKDKVNEIVSALAKCVLIPLALTFGATAIAATNAVYSVAYEELMSNASVVTNITFGDVTFTETDPVFSSWTNNSVVSLGRSVKHSGIYTVSVGYEVNGNGNYCTAIGGKSTKSGTYGSAYGTMANASGNNATAIGANSSATATSSTSLGYYAKAQAEKSIAIGIGANGSGVSGVAIGNSAKAYSYSVAIGDQAYASTGKSIAIGNSTKAMDSGCAIGDEAYAQANSMGVKYTPENVYFGSKTGDSGASAKSLQDYLDAAGTKPSATVTSASICYKADGSAIAVSVAAAGTLAADLTDWLDGQAQTAFITLATGAAVNDTIKLVGYEDYPRDSEFAASVLRRGDKVYVIPLFGVAN